jgi:predicted small secreted protein
MEDMKHIRFILLSLTATGAVFSTSCATTRGFGQDLQKVGDRIETRAERTGGADPVARPPLIDTAPTAPAAPATPSAY